MKQNYLFPYNIYNNKICDKKKMINIIPSFSYTIVYMSYKNARI